MGTQQSSSTVVNTSTLRLKRAAIVVLIFAVGAWLFGDTYRRHSRHRRRPGVLRFAHFGTYQDYLFWKDTIAEFNRSTGDFRVDQEYVAGLSGHYRTKLRQQALVGNLPDVALVQLAFFREHADLFEDLSQVVLKTHADEDTRLTLDPVGLAAFKRDGVQRGVPVSGGPLVIYINRQCFRTVAEHGGASIPLPGSDWTISDFQRTAEFLTRDFDGDGHLDQFGFYLPRWIYYLPFIWSEGADLGDSTASRWKFRGDEAIQAMTLYQQLALTRRVTPRDHEVAQLFQDTAFLTGRVGMCVNGPWFQPFLAQTALRNDYLVRPIPRGPAGSITRVTWDGIVVTQGLSDERRSNAIRFVSYLLSRNVQKSLARVGKALPARRDTVSEFAAPTEVKRVFTSVLKTARLQPDWSNFRAIDRTMNQYLQDLTRENTKLSPVAMIEALACDPAVAANFAADQEPRP